MGQFAIRFAIRTIIVFGALVALGKYAEHCEAKKAAKNKDG